MVSLQSVLKSTKETQEEFLDRSYWGVQDKEYNMKVMVWNSLKEKLEFGIKPTKIIDIEEARRYIQELESNEDKQKREQEIKEMKK